MTQLAEQEGVSGACRLLAVARSRYYRARRPHLPATSTAAAVEPVDAETDQRPPRKSARALCPAEKSKVRDVLNSAAYQDRSPRQVYAALLDQGEYL